MHIKSTFLSVFFLALVGCGLTSTKPPLPIANQPTASDLADSLKYSDFIKPCPLLPIVSVSPTTTDELMKMYIALEGQYTQCAVKDDCLIVAVLGTTICHVDAVKPQEEPRNGIQGAGHAPRNP